jgi:hypothetical protein
MVFVIFLLSKIQALNFLWKRETTATEEIKSPINQIGLQTIQEPSLPGNSSDPPVNIIFVHGLGGSPDGTWTAKSGAFWPPWLSEIKVFENARILTFGYDSGWNKIWKPNNVLDIADFAKQLANDLWLHYMQHGNVRSSSRRFNRVGPHHFCRP